MKSKKIAIEIICFLFILLFTYAALTKLMDYQKFVVQIGQSPLLTNYAKVLAWAVPLLELIIAGMLAVRRFRMIGLYASFTLMVMFTSYIVAILQLDKNIPCSCGGVLESLGWTEHLIFNSAFVVLGITGVLLYTREKDPGNNEKTKTVEKKSSDAISDKLAEAI